MVLRGILLLGAIAAGLGLGAGVGCKRANPLFCNAEADCAGLADTPRCLVELHECVPLDAPDANLGCDPQNPVCPPNVPFCDEGSRSCRGCTGDPECLGLDPLAPACASGQCVECVASSHCDPAGVEPVCGDGHECRGCQSDPECDHVEGICDEASGHCVAATELIYVDASAPAGNAMCTEAAPCKTITGGLAVVGGSRKTIKVAAGTYTEALSVGGATQVTIIGAGSGTSDTVIRPTVAGATVAVGGTAVVALERLALDQGLGAADSAIECTGSGGMRPRVTLVDVEVRDGDGGGIASSQCDLTISRARVRGNDGAGIVASGGSLLLSRSTVSENFRGGIQVEAMSFVIENSFIVANGFTAAGGNGSPYGGLRVGAGIPASPPSRIELTTIAGNLSGTLVNMMVVHSAGIECVSTAPTLVSNLVADNGPAASVQVYDCSSTFSLIGQTPVPPGQGNLNGDPKFVAPGSLDYHIAAGSACIDAADPATTITVDVDGQVRAPGKADCGADELP